MWSSQSFSTGKCFFLFSKQSTWANKNNPDRRDCDAETDENGTHSRSHSRTHCGSRRKPEREIDEALSDDGLSPLFCQAEEYELSGEFAMRAFRFFAAMHS